MILAVLALLAVAPEEGLHDALRSLLDLPPSSAEDEMPSRYAAAEVDLNGDGRNEAIVYLLGGRWCGSGGCTTLVLERQGQSWRMVTRMSVVQLPIRVLPSQSQGWRDLTVGVRGGGARPAEAILSFDGRSYPRNPTVPPARPASGQRAGQVLIPEDPPVLRL